jgi:integrase
VDTYAVATPEITFADALDRFVTTHCGPKNKASTAKETERILRHNFLPSWGETTVGAITRHDVLRVLDHKRKQPSAANHAFTAIRTFFRWCVRHEYLTNSPCAGLGLPHKQNSRSRVLTDPELVSVWRAAVRAGYPFGTIVQLLILTGQRRGEIARLDRNFINGKESKIMLPPELVKNGREHTFPYLETIPRRNSTSLLFPARGYDDRPFCGFNKGKADLEWRPAIRPWTLHDLRRTFVTNMAALGVAPHVIERLLNHSSGTISGVAAVYNRYSFMPEMREAIGKWDDHLAALLQEPASQKLPCAA